MGKRQSWIKTEIAVGIVAIGIVLLLRTIKGIGSGIPIYLIILPTITGALAASASILELLANKELGRIRTLLILIATSLFTGVLAGIISASFYTPERIMEQGIVAAIFISAFLGVFVAFAVIAFIAIVGAPAPWL